MEFIQTATAFLKEHYIAFFLVMASIWPVLEVITRLTPTKTDDTLLEKVGQAGKKVMDALGIPNIKKDEGLTVETEPVTKQASTPDAPPKLPDV